MYLRNRFSCDILLRYDVPASSQLILAIQAARTGRQFVDDESMSYTGGVFLREDTDVYTGTRRSCFAVPRGEFEIEYHGIVTIAPAWIQQDADAADAVHAGALEPLLPEAFRYLQPSRYAPSDLLLSIAHKQFGPELPPAQRAQSIVDWVSENIAFEPGAGSPHTTAVETLAQRAGVCRDFAHLTIALCRAANLPARYVSGIEIGRSVADQKFCAYVEVLIDGEWRIFDPTHRYARTGLIRLATGLDASNTAFGTVFGPAQISMMQVRLQSLDLPETVLADMDLGVHALSTSSYNDLAEAPSRRIAAVGPASAANARTLEPIEPELIASIAPPIAA